MRRGAKRLSRQRARSRLGLGLRVLRGRRRLERVRLARVNRSGCAESGLVTDDGSALSDSIMLSLFSSHRLVRLLSI